MFKSTLSPVRLTGGIHGRSSTKIKVTYDDRLLGRIFLGGTVRVVRVNRLLPQANYYFSCRKKILVNIYTRTPHTAMHTHTTHTQCFFIDKHLHAFFSPFHYLADFFPRDRFPQREEREREREREEEEKSTLKKNTHTK